jgi:hypothetical protein
MAGEAELNSKSEAVVLFIETVADRVTPPLMTNFPVPAFEISAQVALSVSVMVWPTEARASSPTPGMTPPVHVEVALKLPLAAEVMSAIT